MNTQRLQTLATFLRTVPEEHFDLQSWRASDDHELVSDEALNSLQCGTTGCAVGWACTIPEFKAEGLHWDVSDDGTTDYPGYGKDDTAEYATAWEAVEVFFNINYDTADHLFSCGSYDNNNATANEVADRIEEVIAAGGVK